MASIYGAITVGYECSLIDVECHIANGLPGTTIVGLANKSVDEAKDRLRAAFSVSGLDFPKKKVLVNLAPADLPKNDSGLDLAIAACVLATSAGIKMDTSTLFIGELGLDGGIKPIKGTIGKLLEARKKAISRVFIPLQSAEQASLIPDIDVYGIQTLKELVEALHGNLPKPILYRALRTNSQRKELLIDDIIGQEQAKRAITIAVAGRHNIHMYGPPGTGKTMLSKAASELLPQLTQDEALEVTHLHSLIGAQEEMIVDSPPFRAPHHSASDVSIIGGGNNARPGEISLAHKGVLMLDEFPEYSKKTLESLRQPLEDRQVVVSRAKLTTTYPADFLLIATSNSCPCGYFGSDKPCTCTQSDILRYQKKLSGPIMDRIDMHVQVNSIDHSTLLARPHQARSQKYDSQLIKATIELQMQRNGNKRNSELTAKELEKIGSINTEAKDFMDQAASKMKLSSRGYLKTVKVARTIADLQVSEIVATEHIAEALQYRERHSSL